MSSRSTVERLLDEAERLFALQGIAATTTVDITNAAEQRNSSAVSYHFGSREGLLLAVLARRGGPVDAARTAHRGRLGDDPSTPELVACLVVPYADLLHTPHGRSYLQIVAQLRGKFAVWRRESDEATAHGLLGVLDEIESRPEAHAAIRSERTVSLIMLLTSSTADRARQIDRGRAPALAHDGYVANLVAMGAALIGA